MTDKNTKKDNETPPPEPESYANLTYKVKCRQCGRIMEMWFGTTKLVSYKNFLDYIREHSTFPIEKECPCDTKSITFHDIVSFK